jgi:Na+-driven multidrug efflux pump
MGAIAAFIISLSTLLRKSGYLTFHHKAGWSIHKETTTAIYKVSSSAFVEQVFMRIGFLAYAAIVARLGTTEYATHLICMNILTLSFCFGDGLSIAASALVGQNLGAKRPDLSIIYGKTGQRLAFMISCFIFFIFLFGRTFLVSLFSDEAVIISLGANVMILAALGTHFQTSQVVLSGCLRGAGDTGFVAITSLISVALVRPLLTYLLCFPAGLGVYGAWVALLVDQCFRFITSYYRFSSGKWTSISL